MGHPRRVAKGVPWLCPIRWRARAVPEGPALLPYALSGSASQILGIRFLPSLVSESKLSTLATLDPSSSPYWFQSEADTVCSLATPSHLCVLSHDSESFRTADLRTR